MMRNVYIAALVCFLHAGFILHAQDWKPVNTPTGLDEVKDMIAFKGNLYISTSAVVYRSEDHGLTWELLQIPSSGYTYFLEVQNGELFIISQRYVARSFDGFNWSYKVVATPDVSLIDVTTNGNTFWAATLEGLHSSPDAVTWSQAEDLSSDGFSRITADGTKLFASLMWDAGKIAYSTDGGLNWEFRTIELNTFFSQLDYKDGVLLASSGVEMWRSTDDGMEWTKVRGPGMFFSSESSYYQVGNSMVSTSNDHGSTWSEKSIQLPPYIVQVGAALDHQLFIGAKGGGIYTCAMADPSATWQQVNGQLRHLRVADFEDHKETLFMALESRGVLSSDDEGQTWNQRADATLTLNDDIWFLQTVGNDLYAVDNKSVVFRSPDKGQTWLNLGRVAPLVYVNRTGSYKTWVVIAGSDGVYISKDLGANWTKSPGVSGSIEWITSDNNQLYCGGPQGLMRYNTSAGTWAPVPVNGTTPYIAGIYIIGDVLFIQTNNGYLRSEDDGETWVTIDNEEPYYQFSGRHKSLFRNSDNRLSQSLDLGATWQAIDGNHGPAISFGFSRKNIFAFFHDDRVWSRSVEEFSPPFAESDTAFSAIEPIVVKFDQKPFTLSGNPITQNDLDELITILNSEDKEVEFEATLSTDHLSVTIMIKNPESGVSYTVTIAPVQSASGIKSTGQTIAVKAAVILAIGDESSANVEVYPNPFEVDLTISLHDTNAPLKSVTIFDSLGRPIRTMTANGSHFVMTDVNLGPGVYCLKVVTQNAVYLRRVLKK